MVSGITEQGKYMEFRRIDKGLGTNELCKKVATATGMYFDRSYYRRILVGQNQNEKMIAALNGILDG